MVSCVDQRVDHDEERLHLLGVEHVFSDGVGLESETGCVPHEQIAG
jgi:hypothetical protein